MVTSISNKKIWSRWHTRLHQKLLKNPDLLPKDASLLLSVSGGKDSMSLLKLILDLTRHHNWKINIWHGDHCWHDKSHEIANELKDWCHKNSLNFYWDRAKKNQSKTEASSRQWRYECLLRRAAIITSNNSKSPCEYILTGHTASDRAETLLLNLARGSDLGGLSSLREYRLLDGEIKLVRPLLEFNQDETTQICKDLKLPVWHDPSNEDLHLSRNKVRKKVLPILESLHPGCSIRIAALAERLTHYKEDQNTLAKLALGNLQHPQGLCRKSLSRLPKSLRATLLFHWLEISGAPNVSAKQLENLSMNIVNSKTPGFRQLAQGWRISWVSDAIQLEKLNRTNAADSQVSDD